MGKDEGQVREEGMVCEGEESAKEPTVTFYLKSAPVYKYQVSHCLVFVICQRFPWTLVGNLYPIGVCMICVSQSGSFYAFVGHLDQSRSLLNHFGTRPVSQNALAHGSIAFASLSMDETSSLVSILIHPVSWGIKILDDALLDSISSYLHPMFICPHQFLSPL